MVEHVPTGTAIINERWCELLREVSVQQPYRMLHGKKYVIDVRRSSSRLVGDLTSFRYVGELDERFAVFLHGEYMSFHWVIVLSKDITQETHTVSMCWVDHSHKMTRLKERTAVAVVKPKEVMKW